MHDMMNSVQTGRTKQAEYEITYIDRKEGNHCQKGIQKKETGKKGKKKGKKRETNSVGKKKQYRCFYRVFKLGNKYTSIHILF